MKLHKKTLNYFFICLISLIIGIIFFAYQKDWIIIRFPMQYQTEEKQEINNFKKNIKLFFWNNSRWNNETVEIIISQSESDNIFRIINNWLTLLDDEKILEKVTLQSALINKTNQEVYLSFDRNILDEESSTYEKLMLIEGLLKTLRENEIPIKRVFFLVHHNPMVDTHLEFSNAWPIQGFLEK